MKKTHIALLVLVVVAISVISATFLDFSTYETFGSASKVPGKAFHVIGFFDKGKGISYDPKVDPNQFTFYATDKSGVQRKVVFVNGAPPRDIDKSEQLVMKGYVKGDAFYCNGIQMKCPSKYKKDMTIGESS
ncbi:MAG: cytochrome c maturation protein CcmE [Taibaiella sp.]|nr:cytochrome c maturation protein CcmE [Taibaiella sp.]